MLGTSISHRKVVDARHREGPPNPSPTLIYHLFDPSENENDGNVTQPVPSVMPLSGTVVSLDWICPNTITDTFVTFSGSVARL
jgi:hypothetical protein